MPGVLSSAALLPERLTESIKAKLSEREEGVVKSRCKPGCFWTIYSIIGMRRLLLPKGVYDYVAESRSAARQPKACCYFLLVKESGYGFVSCSLPCLGQVEYPPPEHLAVT
jgi:hypothetical protein